MNIKENFDILLTEMNNPNTVAIDDCPTIKLVKMINSEDEKIAAAIREELPVIAAVIDETAARLKRGGRMFYIGAGTSGRIGILDASECYATFGVPTEMVQPLVAGGYAGILDASSGDEDDVKAGENEIDSHDVTVNDVVIGITASGRTPYVLGAIKAANLRGALTVGICNNKNTGLSQLARFTIAPLTGPEAIQGSTRMKAGTSQKMILNMISTGVMVKLGKVYKNMMVDMLPNNDKSFDRAVRLIMESTGADKTKAREYYSLCGSDIKAAIVCILLECDEKTALSLLKQNGGNIRSLMREADRG